MKMFRSGRGQLAAVLLLLVWLGGLWLFCVHEPLLAARRASEAEAQAARRELLTVQNFANREQAKSAGQAEQRRWETLLAAALPASLETGDFLAALARRASDGGLTLRSLTPSEPFAREDGLGEQSLTLSLSGDYFSLVQFLQELADLQAGGRFVKVNQCEVRTTAETDGILSATLSLSVFSLTTKVNE